MVFDEAFNQITKAAETIIIQAVIIKKQYQDLFAAYKKEKRKY